MRQNYQFTHQRCNKMCFLDVIKCLCALDAIKWFFFFLFYFNSSFWSYTSPIVLSSILGSSFWVVMTVITQYLTNESGSAMELQCSKDLMQKKHLGLSFSEKLKKKLICYLNFLQHLLRVVPVVGILSDKQAFKPKLNANEVETIFDAPLEMFLKVCFGCLFQGFELNCSFLFLNFCEDFALC